MQKARNPGFTLLEMLIVIGIVAVIASVSAIELFGRRSATELTSATQQIGALLREAQSDSMSGKQGAQWGVHFDNATSTDEFFSLFYTTNGTYASGTIVGQYTLPAQVCFASSSVPLGSSSDVIFSPVSGAPNASATITLELITSVGCAEVSNPSVTGGIVRNTSGEIFFDDFQRPNL